MPSNPKHLSPAVSLGVLAIVLVGAYFIGSYFVSSSHGSPAPLAFPTATAQAEPVCPRCSEPAAPASFFFIGTYLDAKCSSQPVVHSDALACSTIKTGGVATVMFSNPTGKYKASESVAVPIGRQVTPDEVGHMFRNGCTDYEGARVFALLAVS
jgi:hypothetical protein